jgi:phage terminase large subunit GpA-like protein
MAYAGSPTALSSKPIRYVLYDEVNKYPAFSGKEADPVELGGERTRTYGRNRCEVLASTPTIAGGYIDISYRESDQRTYRVPCPHCDAYQELAWSNVHWPRKDEEKGIKGASPARLRAERLAWYECAECGTRIEESQKSAMILRGVWCPAGRHVSKGIIVGDIQQTTHRGYRINALYSPWLCWSEVAAKFLECFHDAAKLMNFTNSWLGEEWEEVVDGVRLEVGENLDATIKLGTPPADTIALVGGGDVQSADIDHLWYSVYALLPGERIQLIEYGRINADLEQTDFDRLWDEVLCATWRTVDGRELELTAFGADRRWRTGEVDKFCRRAPSRIFGVQGAAKNPIAHVSTQYVDSASGKSVRARRNTLKVNTLDTVFFKNEVARLVHEGKWLIPAEGTEQYCQQFASEHKCVERTARGVISRQYWELRPGHRENHLWDTAVYAAAVAYLRGFFQDRLKPSITTTKKAYSQKTGQKGGWQIGR